MDRDKTEKKSLDLIRQGGTKLTKGVGLLFKLYSSELRRFFAYHCGNSVDADDLVQETFVKIVKSVHTYQGKSPINFWIWRIARNCLNDYFRARKGVNIENLDDDGRDYLENTSPDLTAEEFSIDRESIEDCVHHQFEIFAQRSPTRAYALSLKMEGHTTRFISAVIQRTEGATREFLSQSRKKIQDFLLPCKELLST